MNRFLCALLLITTQPIFCGGVLSSLSQGQNNQDISANDEQLGPDNIGVSQGVSFECDHNRPKTPFKINYQEFLNGICFKSSFSWSDPEAKDNCDAIERRLAQENDPIKKRALTKALHIQRVFQGRSI